LGRAKNSGGGFNGYGLCVFDRQECEGNELKKKNKKQRIFVIFWFVVLIIITYFPVFSFVHRLMAILIWAGFGIFIDWLLKDQNNTKPN
jgi:hypothetical protein